MTPRESKQLGWICNTVIFFSALMTANGYPFYGFCTMAIGNVLFVYFGYKTKQYSFLFYNLLFFATAINGIIYWR